MPRYDRATCTDELCRRLRNGQTLSEACRKSRTLPTRPTVYRWIDSNPSLRVKLRAARRFWWEIGFADEFLELADSATPETANAVKTRLWARSWLAGKLLPSIFGTKPEDEQVDQTVNVIIGGEATCETVEDGCEE